MRFSIRNEKVTIFKDERGVTSAYVANKELDENGEPYYVYARIVVGFRKGVEIKNKAKIKINDGFLTFYQVDTGEFSEQTGKPIKRNYFKIVVMDFDVLEEGIDEPYGYSNKTTENNTSEKSSELDNFEDFRIYGGAGDDLPF